VKGGLTTAFAVAVLGVVAILIVPLPPPLLDALLALNVFGSALVLLISLRVEEPLEFSAFAPSLLLATLFRLALDVSATRLILTDGHDPTAVGALIPAFGAFVVRGNVVVGLIVFAILITIQFVVIASGAQRGYYTTTNKRPLSVTPVSLHRPLVSRCGACGAHFVDDVVDTGGTLLRVVLDRAVRENR
jgi:hypothetical protein